MVIEAFCEFLEGRATLRNNVAFWSKPSGLADTHWDMCLALLVVLLRLQVWHDPAPQGMRALP